MKLVDVIAVGDMLGESPLWDGRTGLLYWIDIHGETIGAFHPTSGDWSKWPTGRRFGSVALTSSPGTLLAATATGLELISLQGDQIVELGSLGSPEADIPGNRFNDGKTDRHGRFWVGTMEDAETGLRTGAMYRLDLDGTLTRTWGNIGIPNGMCFSPDGTIMYTADSMDRTLREAEYDLAAGTPGPRTVFADIVHPGSPDGSTVDAAGNIWNTEWGASRLVRYLPSGEVDLTLEVPAAKPTCPAFGGSDLDVLFVTTAQVGPGFNGDYAGSMLVYDVGVTGIAETPYPLAE